VHKGFELLSRLKPSCHVAKNFDAQLSDGHSPADDLIVRPPGQRAHQKLRRMPPPKHATHAVVPAIRHGAMSTASCGDGNGPGEADGMGPPPLSGHKRKLSVADAEPASHTKRSEEASKDGRGLLEQAIEESIANFQRVVEMTANLKKEHATAADIDWCRKFLLEVGEADRKVQTVLTSEDRPNLIPAGQKTSRMCYLKTLTEAFKRPQPTDGALEREWDQMCSEGDGAKFGDAPPSYEEVLEQYNTSINERIAAGWEEAHAIHYCLLSSVHARGPMARALSKEADKERDRYAHSAYALMDSLQSRIEAAFPESNPRDAEDGEDHPGRYHRNLAGSGSLHSPPPPTRTAL
jgi:hypothetical protein